jgi:K+-sensing histidine kinase KdpD
MASEEKSREMDPTRFAEMVVRTLRHEVGDLLQSVYSAVAILLERLPPEQTLERGILSDLRGRAETCKNELDAAHDLVCPLKVSRDWVDLGELVGGIAASFSLRYPELHIVCDATRSLKVWADAQRIAQAGTLLLTSLCQAAQNKVEIRVVANPENKTVEWSFSHDGARADAEQLSWITAPFSTTRHARFGLGLAFACRVIELHDGHVMTGEALEGGFRVVLVLPVGQPEREF